MGSVLLVFLSALSLLMTFPKVSGGGRVCEAGSRGQGEMLQQIYSRWGGTGEDGAEGGGERAWMDILP